MAAKKYITLDENGNHVEKSATVVSSGTGNAGDLVALGENGRADVSIMPLGIGVDTVTCPASEALVAGEMVNLYNNGGILNARKADATGTGAGKRTIGFVKSGFTSGENATVYVSGINDQLTGLTPGTTYYLSTIAGAITATAPAATGNIAQEAGRAISATQLLFSPGIPVQRA